MARIVCVLLAVVLLVAGILLGGTLVRIPGMQRTGEIATDNWSVTYLDHTDNIRTFWIINLQRKDGSWTGTIVARLPNMPESKIDNLNVTEDRVAFTIQMGGQNLVFEGKPSADGRKVLGSIGRGQRIFLAEVDRTAAQTLEAAAQADRTGPESGFQVFPGAWEALATAEETKAGSDDVRGLANKTFLAAEPYGRRWQRETALRTTDLLLEQKGYDDIALEFARRAERHTGPRDGIGAQLRTLKTLAKALGRAGKADEAKEVEGRLAKIDVAVPIEKFTGRTNKSDRAVLVELLIGAESHDCVAPTLAFDAVAKSFQPGEVVPLEYHLHIPGPDPLTNQATRDRLRYYADEIRGTPALFFNGKRVPELGGSFDDGPAKYQHYRALLAPLLEQPSAVKLKISAVRKENQIDITAAVSDLEQPSATTRLRLVLVEEQVDYSGSNGLTVYHHVVRSCPGGAEGLSLGEKNAERLVSVDLSDLRKELTDYMDEVAKIHGFPNKQRPLALEKLLVVAYVQNDETKEVLQATQAEVRGP